MRSILIFGTILFAKIAFAQSVSTQMGARATALGYASSGLADEWSLFNNPGGLAKITQTNAAFAYEVNAQLKGANRMGAIFNMPTKWGVASAGLFRFGDDLYNEQALSIGFGNQFGIASLGMKVNLVQYNAEGFGVTTAISFDFGGIAELTEKLSIGAYITNLTQSRMGDEDERLPTRLTAGLLYKLEKNILVTTELAKELDYIATWRTGLEYSFHQKVFFRTGFNLNPNTACFGLGIRKKKLRLDYAVRFNPLTGALHQASAVYSFSKNIEK